MARRTQTRLIVMCSRDVTEGDVMGMAAEANVEAYAFDLPPGYLLKVNFDTSDDKELFAASPGWDRDLSMKRNIGLVLACLLDWPRLMFLDDDIYSVGQHDVSALAAALEDHSVSALIPKWYPDNSVVCHANRLSGGQQDVFASASGIGVRCHRELAFFPNLYNEDWFFFAEEAAKHRIAKVGESRQRKYDPYDHSDRAAREEFGDLLAEGLYARLDNKEGIWDADIDYWRYFRERRFEFHQQVIEALGRVDAQDRSEATRATKSVYAAQQQLEKIPPELCQKFMRLWRNDLDRWRDYLASLPHRETIAEAFRFLNLKPLE